MKNNINSFSIIIPVYNVADYVDRCLKSVLNQTYSKFEVIIVYSNSNDDSEVIIDTYLSDKRFKKIVVDNAGLSHARNEGLNVTKNDYIMFLDGDDFLESDALYMLNNNLNESLEILRFQAREVYSNRQINMDEESFECMSGIDAFNNIIKYHFIENSWSYVYKKSFWDANNFKFMENCIAEDFGLTPLILAKAKSVKSISYIGYNYVQRENSLMNNKDYSKKIKKMEDMLKQAEYLKDELKKIEGTKLFESFINNSLIYYSTTLNKCDYKKYNKQLKKMGYYNHLVGENAKQKIKFALIRTNSWFFYHYLAR